VGQKGRGRPRSTSRKLQPDRQRTLVVGLSLLANTLPWSRAATVGTAAGRGSMNAVSACAPGLRAFEAAVSAVGPDKLVSENIAVNGADEQAVLHLVSTNEDIPIPQGVRLVAFGKASIAMARAAERKLGPALRTGIVISQPSAESAPESCSDLKSKVHVGSAGNLPDSAAVIAAGEALSIARGAREGEVLMVLVSGGGSALLPLPAEPLTLEDKLTTTRMMAAAG
jgi:glycerate 2-kinase